VTSSATARTYAKPWVSKFHPVHWDDLVGNDEAVYILRTMIDHAAVPHLILAGPPGVGKSSAITCFVRQFYPDAAQRRTAVLEINAAEENKQDVFIDKIPTFIKRARQLPDDRRAIVVLEEAENLSENAQRNLWVCMRRYANVIFVLTGNDMERLKPYILGRCCRLAFGPIRAEQLKARCGQVLDRLGVAYKASALDALCQVANGDLRRAMNLVQMAAQSVQSVQSMPASETTPEATKSTSGMELDGDQVYRLTWGLTVDDVVAWLQVGG
jgi:replication factor C small subunit